ncbi:MAG: hypothetical protein J6T89_03515 [Bacteroidales bacterium]|nr:hypothetical protein [Bacteroidales bacterium]
MLEDIRKQIQQLIALYEGSKAEAASLREQLSASRQDAAALKERILELESEIETRELAQAFSPAADNSAAKEKLDMIIKEIGTCISCLESD